jgi:O-antigen/teichoic acid export membrane protein
VDSIERTLSLTQRAGRAIGFRVIGSALDVTLSLALGITLARILPPKEFGLFGITASIIAIAEILGSCGMLRALVQRKDFMPEHRAAAAIFQFSSAVVIGWLLYLGAPVTEDLFGMPGLAMVMRLQAGVLLIHSVALLPESELNRRLAFDRLTVIRVSSRMLGGVAAIILAIQGIGAMALAFGSLANAAASTLLLWVCAPGVIPLRFRLHHLRDLISYGSGILFINIANIFAQRLDTLIIGRQVGSEAVGLYQRASQLALLPLSQVTGPLDKVLFSAMSSIQGEQKRFQRGYVGATRLSALIAFPLLTILGTTADVLVPWVYGPMWMDTVPILQILAVSGIFRLLLNTHGLVAQASGQAMAEARRQGIWLLLVAACGFFGSYAGVLGVTIGVTVATCIFFISMTYLALSIAAVQLVEWLKAIQTGILGSALMGLTILVLKNLFVERLSYAVLLGVIACSGVSIYIVVLRFCLTRQDNELLESMCGILPSCLGAVLRSILGVTPKSLASNVRGMAST